MKSIEWCGDSIRLIDQTKLPLEEHYLQITTIAGLVEAIRSLRIRGAPAIGIAAAYGVVLAARNASASDMPSFCSAMRTAMHTLAETRPTAVNLRQALRRIDGVLASSVSIDEARIALLDEALAIHREDAEMCLRIGEHGADCIPRNARVLTHCNTGALATGGDGTAFSVILRAHRQGKNITVYAGETRPLLQGARLTTWECLRQGIPVTLITDNMAASLMERKEIDLVIVGADRIAANGDTANKIGTYGLAVLARFHSLPFFVAAPWSTIDPETPSGKAIPIEERQSAEVLEIAGTRIAPSGVRALSPAFDITPASLISAIITDRGLFTPPYRFDEGEEQVHRGSR